MHSDLAISAVRRCHVFRNAVANGDNPCNERFVVTLKGFYTCRLPICQAEAGDEDSDLSSLFDLQML